jgi:hypothetical protein
MIDAFTPEERAEFEFIIKRHHGHTRNLKTGEVTTGNGATVTNADDFDREKWKIAQQAATVNRW